MENSIAALKSRISNQTKIRQFVAESLVGPSVRVVGISNDLTRSRPCCEGKKSEIRGVGKGIGDRRASVEGERRSLSLTASEIGTSDEWTCLISRLGWVEKTALGQMDGMECR
ncbi:hypothetical protein AVEN_235709-1 [Araneus ventricosus]|uniref:Uncharacterized protein n=1 Tax=Araneus ventricosus TaxID=182803 RepID=A0A4Y2Q9Z4_ARAVE|nr:hypothetical protein AVEN_235709-1 [Araneus ventricosus]